MDVANWLRALGLERYEATFRENDVDAELLPNLAADDLKELGIPSLGHRRRLLEAIAALRPESTPASDPVRLSSHPPTNPTGNLVSPETTAERRPLSVMFCDLVGSTALSSRLDAEDLREVIRTYQARVATTIHQYDGFIARYVGDGVLIYFGWPEARETDAERVVRAGLAVAAAVSQEPVGGEPLHVRIGIATGLVVIGEPIGSGDSRQQTAIGETPNLAARLQGLAGPNQVVIDAATRRQIGGLFECQDLGTIELKGLPVAVPAWQVLSENRALGQFEALRSGATPLVGRDEEMELLLRRWVQAKAGNGRVVLISAEPGVGKSRLAEALAERISAEPHIRLRYFCSPHHQDSALYPVIAQMERAAGFAHADGPAARLAKLRAVLAAGTSSMEDMALIAELHSLSSADFTPPLDLTPQRKKDKTFEALLRQVESLLRQQPVLMIFDDLHWIDPSSRELLDHVTERVADWPVLLLAMFRPEFQPPWTGQPHVTMLTLPRLDRRDTAAMVANVAGNAALPLDIIEEIAERADGVPLFVEELTKTVLESGPQARAALFAVPHPVFSVPPTLHASLMARLDRLGPAAKDVAQVGAAIGREFSHELLASTIDLPEPQLREALGRLTNAGLLIVRGTPPQSNYIFKHALVQDAAYSMLLRGQRQELHARIGKTLEERFPGTVTMQPEILAHHFAQAGLFETAITWWRKAGEFALGRSANAEAVAHLSRGIELTQSLPPGYDRNQREFAMILALGSATRAINGHASPESLRVYSRARELLSDRMTIQEQIAVLYGLWSVNFVRAEFIAARDVAGQSLTLVARHEDPEASAFAHRMMGLTCSATGMFADAVPYLNRAVTLFGPGKANVTDLRYSQDHYVWALGALAITLWPLGFPEQAVGAAEQALGRAHEMRHAMTTGFAYIFGLMLNGQFQFDRRRDRALSDEASAYCDEHKLVAYAPVAQFYRGAAQASRGDSLQGINLMRESLAATENIHFRFFLPTFLGHLASAHAAIGQTDLAMELLRQASQTVRQTDERYFEAELYRLRGELLISQGKEKEGVAELGKALVVSREQQARMWELRAATKLAGHWADRGKRTEARELLAQIYGWFTEGFDTSDLKEAKALLQNL